MGGVSATNYFDANLDFCGKIVGGLYRCQLETCALMAAQYQDVVGCQGRGH